MSQIEGRDHKLIAQVVDAKVDELRDELKGDITALGADIKYSIGLLTGKLDAAQLERTEAARHVQQIATKLDQHIGANEDAKRPWWQNPAWLSAAAFVGVTVLAILLALGEQLVTRIVEHFIGG